MYRGGTKVHAGDTGTERVTVYSGAADEIARMHRGSPEGTGVLRGASQECWKHRVKSLVSGELRRHRRGGLGFGRTLSCMDTKQLVALFPFEAAPAV